MGPARWIHKKRSRRFTKTLSPICFPFMQLQTYSRLRGAGWGKRRWMGAPLLFASRIGILVGAVFTRAASPWGVAPVPDIPTGCRLSDASRRRCTSWQTARWSGLRTSTGTATASRPGASSPLRWQWRNREAASYIPAIHGATLHHAESTRYVVVGTGVQRRMVQLAYVGWIARVDGAWEKYRKKQEFSGKRAPCRTVWRHRCGETCTGSEMTS